MGIKVSTSNTRIKFSKVVTFGCFVNSTTDPVYIWTKVPEKKIADKVYNAMVIYPSPSCGQDVFFEANYEVYRVSIVNVEVQLVYE